MKHMVAFNSFVNYFRNVCIPTEFGGCMPSDHRIKSRDNVGMVVFRAWMGKVSGSILKAHVRYVGRLKHFIVSFPNCS